MSGGRHTEVRRGQDALHANLMQKLHEMEDPLVTDVLKKLHRRTSDNRLKTPFE